MDLGLKKIIFIVLSFVLFIISCRNRVNWKYLSQEDLGNFRKEFNLPEERTFRLDTNYIRYLFSFDTAKHAAEIQNHYQPIQATFYDKKGNLISFHTNCYASAGIPDDFDFNWNQQNAFEYFVPRTVAPIDSILPLSRHLSFIRTFDNNPIDTTGFSAFDYTIIIHWSKKWRAKDAKNLIRIVSNNANLAVNKKLNMIYVNSDDTLQ